MERKACFFCRLALNFFFKMNEEYDRVLAECLSAGVDMAVSSQQFKFSLLDAGHLDMQWSTN